MSISRYQTDELIYDVQFIFSDYLKCHDCAFYNIPEYQRGYKWTADNVIQLLDDLKNFKKASDDEFYCLQNITVTKTEMNGMNCLNVIDGQQRLTTLFILLSYRQKDKVNKMIAPDADILRYSIRKSTDDFLRNKVLTGELWYAGNICPEDAASKDQYYIMEVAKAIATWFEEGNEISDAAILKDLKLIVNVVDPGEEETVFASLNGGKVDLDGADLLRAILITRAAKQKYPTMISEKRIRQISNDDVDLDIHVSLSSRGKINEYRVKLGVELDQMNRWWSDKDVQAYFVQLLPNRIARNKSFRINEYPIDLLYYAFFEAYKQNLLRGKSQEEIVKERDLDLRFFENGIDLNGQEGDDHLELFNAVKEMHLAMVDWYNDDEIYNLVGYLMYNYKGVVVSFDGLWGLWKESSSKSAFKQKLKNIIKYQLAIAFDGDDDSSNEAKKATFERVAIEGLDTKLNEKLIVLRQAINNCSMDWYNHAFTYRLLPLFDILPFEVQLGKKTKKVIKRVKQSYLKRIDEEDKEHVRAKTRDIDADILTDQEKRKLEEENLAGLNSLGNLVLLHLNVNRSYGNDKLQDKMMRIFGEHVAADDVVYIRPYTLDVFMSKMKTLDQNGANENDCFWSDEDIKRTLDQIDKRIGDYLNWPVLETTPKTEENYENGKENAG